MTTPDIAPPDAATRIDAAIAMGWSGPDDHGITLTARHIASAAITLGFGGAVLHEAQPDRLMNLVDRLPPSTRLLHLQVNDWLFADAGMDVDHTIATLADRLQRRRVALAMTLHDLPQRSNGDALYRRRCNTYRQMVAASVGVAVSSEHERLLLQEALRHTPAAEVSPVSAGGPAGVPLVVIPLPIEPMVTSGPTHGLPTPTLDRTRPGDPVAPTIGIFGYLYPGKGHREVIEALTGMDSGPAVVAIGRASDRHTELLDDLTELAARRGIVFRCTGYVSDADLPGMLRSVTVPLAPHTHISASGSINSWLAAGRRPLVPAGRYVDELERRMPGSMWIYQPGQLRQSVERAIAQPELTWLPPDLRVEPTTRMVAQRYLEWLRSLGDTG